MDNENYKYRIVEKGNKFTIEKRVLKVRKSIFNPVSYYWTSILKDDVRIGKLGPLDTDRKVFNSLQEAKDYIKNLIEEEEVKYHYICGA